VVRRCIVTVACLFTTIACRPQPAATPAVPPAISVLLDSTDALTPEYDVYAAVLVRLKQEVTVASETHTAWNCDPPSPFICDRRRIPAEFLDALRDYQEKGVTPTTFVRTPAPSQPIPAWRVPRGEKARCWPRPTVSLSRVGLAGDGERAVVSYSLTSGPGPYPGCGYSSGEFLLLRRDQSGDWHVVSVAGGWIT
jgi:hypothetical protein